MRRITKQGIRFYVMAKLAEDVRSKGNVMPIDIINMTPKLTPFILDDDSRHY